MDISTHTQMAGFFKMEAIKPDGSKRLLAPWQKNLMLDSGLDNFGILRTDSSTAYTTGWFARVSIGEGTSVPTVGQTALTSHLTQVTLNQFLDSQGSQSSTSPYYRWVRYIGTFAQGAATGNLTEIGVGPPDINNLSTRSLIKDGAGNPTTVTVLADEQLSVTYEIRTYQTVITAVDSQITIDSILYDIKTMLSDFDGGTRDPRFGAGISRAFVAFGTTLPNISVDFIGAPSGIQPGNASPVFSAYSTGTYALTCEFTFGINAYTGGAKGVTAMQLHGTTQNWQVSFTQNLADYGIPHDNTNELKLTYTHTWDRYTPP